ncbi:MAG: penicillin acylase family protein, partial [Myxococcota bacterium]
VGNIQNDITSVFGERLTPFLLELADRVAEERATPGTHPGLAMVAGQPDAVARLETLRPWLDDWSFQAEDGIWGSPTEAQQRDAVATSLFNVWATMVLRRTFGDERRAAPALSVTSQQQVKALLWLLEHPGEVATRNAETGESWLWDDMETEEMEYRDTILFMAFMDADAELATLFGSNAPEDWLWGELHTRVFDSIIPDLSGEGSPLTWPQPDEGYPNGYPRGGDNYNVDRCDGGVTDTRYQCGGGAILRFVVELDPEGIRARNAMPGGQVWDPASPFFRDDLDLWLDYARHPIPFHPEDVEQNHNSHTLFAP